MKLLIITQKVDINDDVLGFFHRWIEEFAKYCEKVTVICLQKGEYNLPQNVKILSLGKEESLRKKGLSLRRDEVAGKGETLIEQMFQRLKYVFRFYKYIWRERKNYDSVFVHMNPEYAVLGGLLWKATGKKIALWYTHKAVNLKLRLAEKLADKIFTASKESFRLPSKKVEITGHGIDISKFESGKRKVESGKKDKFKIITAGRIASIKNVHVMLEAAAFLKKDGMAFEMKIAGAPVIDADKTYFRRLQKEVQEKNINDCVFFVGAIQHKNIPTFYQGGDLFLNLSDTGSLDKATLEAMASGINVLTSNEVFFDILPSQNILKNLNARQLAVNIKFFMNNNVTTSALREIVASNHALEILITRFVSFLL